MNREWYNIDVRKEVLNDIQEFLQNNDLDIKIIDKIKNVSVRDMMDLAYVSNLEGIGDSEAFSRFVCDRYMYYRGEKYGQEGFWEAASTERNIGYNGEWYEYITDMLKKHCKIGDKVLFVGTADGKEIPNNQYFRFYALEQIGKSVNNIDSSKVVESFEADFEDDSFVIGVGKEMNAIIALRCLMPNTRLSHFFRFVGNNLNNQGSLILSHPMGFLDKDNYFKNLPDCRDTLRAFDERLKMELVNFENMHVIHEEETCVEHFYIIKVD